VLPRNERSFFRSPVVLGSDDWKFTPWDKDVLLESIELPAALNPEPYPPKEVRQGNAEDQIRGEGKRKGTKSGLLKIWIYTQDWSGGAESPRFAVGSHGSADSSTISTVTRYIKL
jgi:hypothetical protein